MTGRAKVELPSVDRCAPRLPLSRSRLYVAFMRNGVRLSRIHMGDQAHFAGWSNDQDGLKAPT